MTTPKRVGVIDIGKTNAKLALVDAGSGDEILVEKRPNAVLRDGPWPHFDLEGHWRFILGALSRFNAEHSIEGISVTTHGASAVLLDAQGELAAPMLDYEHDGPDSLAAQYDAIRPPFAQTGTPRLGCGLNLGAQLHWMFKTDPGLSARTAHVLTYPQYWGYRLTGEMACDVSSLGCHTDLWNPYEGKFSALVDRLGLSGKMAPVRLPSEILGTVTPQIAAQTGLAAGTPVSVGIHDSNASLYPYVRSRSTPFAVVSTGTWVVAMAMDGDRIKLDPARDTLVNVNAQGAPVPSARFMGGREFDIESRGLPVAPTTADRRSTLESKLMVLPAIEPGSGPFRGRQAQWTGQGSDGERLIALSWYLALMTDTCLSLVGARGPAIIEGPLGANADFCAMLATLRPEGVEVALSATGTSAGAALLLSHDGAPPQTRRVAKPENATALAEYARLWRSRTETMGA